MPTDLEDFERAFDEAAPPPRPERDRRRAERAVRRRLRAPTRALVGSLLALAACVAAGLHGIEGGWMVAVFLFLVVLPERWSARRRLRARAAAVDAEGDLRALCAKEAHRAAAGAVLGAFLLALLAVLYLATALVAFLLGKSALPGTVAALVVLAVAAYRLVVILPRAAREHAVLRG